MKRQRRRYEIFSQTKLQKREQKRTIVPQVQIPGQAHPCLVGFSWWADSSHLVSSARLRMTNCIVILNVVNLPASLEYVMAGGGSAPLASRADSRLPRTILVGGQASLPGRSSKLRMTTSCVGRRICLTCLSSEFSSTRPSHPVSITSCSLIHEASRAPARLEA